MTDVKKTAPGARPVVPPPPPPPPPPPKAEPGARGQRAAAPPPGDTNAVKAASGPLAPPKPVDLDRILANAGLALTAVGNMAEPTQTVADAAANAADVVLNAEEASKVVKALPKVNAEQSARFAKALDGAAKAGKVAGAALAAVSAQALFKAVHPTFDAAAAGEAVTNLALGLATALEDVAPAVLGKAGFGLGAVSSLFALGADIKDAQEKRMNPSNVMGMVGNALSAAGSIAAIIPGGQPIGAALLMAGAAVNLARLAVDNWDTIADAGNKALATVGGWFGAGPDQEAGPRQSVVTAQRAAPAPT